MKKIIEQSYKTALNLLTDFITEANTEKTIEIAKKLATAFEKGNKVIICGNGGSATDAMHFAEEFTGRFRKNRKALPAIALTDPAHITCTANDFGFDYVFSRGIEAFGKAGDVFIGLSTSGNSQNIINAINTAKKQNLTTIALLGKDGGKIKSTCDFEFIINGKTSDRIQEIHMLILHIIIEAVERIMFSENY